MISRPNGTSTRRGTPSDSNFAATLRYVEYLPERGFGMFERVRSLLRAAWPLLGSAYLLYLALQPPPVRYVGAVGLVIVTPLLIGWAVGRLFGIGPWATFDRSD